MEILSEVFVIRCIKLSFFLISLLMIRSVDAAAIVPVILSDPSPFIASSYAVGDSVLITYTITNNVRSRFPITVSGISSPVTRTTVSNDCGNILPMGPSTCNIGLTIAPASGMEGQSINQTLSIDYQGRVPLKSPISFSVAQSTGGASALTVVGQNTTTFIPLIASSQDHGVTWSSKTISGVSLGQYTSVSCTPESNAICIAAGGDDSIPVPLFARSTDSGATWVNQAIVDPAVGYLNGVSSVGTGGSALFIAGGNDISAPLILVSNNAGSTWTNKPITNNPTNGFILSTSCTGTGTSAICAGAGTDTTNGIPCVIVSVDGGNTWTNKTIPSVPNGDFNGVSCTGSGANAVCAAVGKTSTASPYLAVSTDGGNTWSSKSISGSPASGTLRQVSCTGSGSSAICVAAGEDSSLGFPLVVVSNDGGNNWSTRSIIGNLNGSFNAVGCTGIGSSAICTAAGANAVDGKAYIAVSTDGGDNWAAKTITNNLIGTFNTASCIGTGSSAICFAAGDGNGIPYLAISLDGASNWANQSILNNAPTGFFLGSNASFKKFLKKLSPP